jgi:hypothetical protein
MFSIFFVIYSSYILSNSCTLRTVNDLKSNGFSDNYSMKA